MHPSLPIQSELQFLKLGGSLITDKTRPQTPRLEMLESLASEIAAAFRQNPGLKLVLGHGSGSYGHVSGRKYGTRSGVNTPEQWRGFSVVWRDAALLNRLVMEALCAAGLPAMAFPPSAGVTARDGQVEEWNLAPLQGALDHQLLPVVYGDVAFDSVRGGTILSTEDLFTHLADHLRPSRLLLAGIEPGVWADFPTCSRLVDQITPRSFAQVAANIFGSSATDVTGGMSSKVQQSLDMVQRIPGLQIRIFSGEAPGSLERALLGEHVGTRIKAD
jgi:isopentenyl phosphate kinase